MKFQIIFVLAAAAFSLHADQVTMKNGDRLTGKIVLVDDKNLVFKSDLAGEVKIPWESVEAIEAPEPLHLVLKDGQTLVGTLQAQAGQFTITTTDTGTVNTKKESVATIRSNDEQQRYLVALDRLQNPRLLDLWTGNVDANYAATRGNAETNTVSVGANAARTTSRDKITINFVTLNSDSRISGATVTTANATRGGLKYSLDLSKRLFTFAFTDLEFDEFQRLDLRFVIGGGAGYHAIKTEQTQFDLSLGANLNKEFFSTGLRRTSGELQLGEELQHKFTKTYVFSERLTFYPNLSDTGNYRMNFDLGFAAAINRWLAWTVNVSDRYLSNPVFGAKKNDIIYTTGLRLTFAKEPVKQ